MTEDGMELLGRIGGRVEAELGRFLDGAGEHVPSHDPKGGLLLEAVSDLTLRGGKRLRPALAYLAAVSLRPEVEVPGLVGACASLELLQSYLLIHDDIMDDDDVRRGGPTIHRMLAGPGEDAAARQRGRDLAILAGDLACVAARLMLQDSGTPRLGEAQRVLARMEWEVIHGQLLDVSGSPDVAAMHDLKTGSYTTRGPVRFGAALAGASDAQVEVLGAYAHPLGLAFQLRDDLLDVTGDPAKTGKPVGTDLREGRVSAVIREALSRADDVQRARLEAAWGRGSDLPDRDLAEALDVLRATGAVEACAGRVRSLTDSAASVLDSAPLRAEGRDGLVAIAAALAARAT